MGRKGGGERVDRREKGWERKRGRGVKREVASFGDTLFSRYKLVGTHP